ncbi:MAG: hypothetical protein UH850_00400 [Paludibacteraceae bacterium]|nr:hypothetical protein [Paludibacteraceae bacterium]
MPRIQKLSQLANLKNFSKFFNAETITDHVAKSLAKEGQRIIRHAYLNRKWKNRTYNLYNSYVAGVIVNGRVRSIMYLGPERAPAPKYNTRGKYGKKFHSTSRKIGYTYAERGRREANNFIMSYAKQHKSKKVTLVIGVAMFYAGILERKGYHVLLGVGAELQNTKAKGLVLTDLKLGNLFSTFGESEGTVRIPDKYIAYRQDISDESRKGRRGSFMTNIK